MERMRTSGSGVSIPTGSSYNPSGNVDLASPSVFPIAQRHVLRHDKLDRLINGAFRSGESILAIPTPTTERLLGLRNELEKLGPLNFGGQEGSEELAELYWRLKAMIAEVVERRSPAEWLDLTRRTRRAPLDHTTLAPRWFLELLTRESSAVPEYNNLMELPHRPDDEVLKDLHSLVLIGSAMWQVGRNYRSVAKGMLLSHLLGPTFVGVGVAPDPRVAEAILLYDHRHFAGFGSRTRRQGSSREIGATVEQLSVPDAVIPGWMNRMDSFQYKPRRVLDLTTCVPDVLSRTAVFDPTQSDEPPSASALGSAATLWTALRRIQSGKKRWMAPRGSWLKWGYIDLSEEEVLEGLERWQPLANQYDQAWTPEEGLRELRQTSMSFSDWVSTSPAVLLVTGDKYRFDLVYSTRVLDEAVPRPSDGAEANKWSKRFEGEVQDVIDRSKWRPPQELRILIGRDVTDNGRVVTDLDAVGYFEGMLLLVDAKAWATSADLEYGDFRAVRNYQEAAEEAVAKWNQKIATIGSRPEMLNVRVPAISEVRGVVVCPDVPYVLPGSCTKVVFSSMRSVGSLKELDAALRGSP
jgi:hypothetical protein